MNHPLTAIKTFKILADNDVLYLHRKLESLAFLALVQGIHLGIQILPAIFIALFPAMVGISYLYIEFGLSKSDITDYLMQQDL